MLVTFTAKKHNNCSKSRNSWGHDPFEYVMGAKKASGKAREVTPLVLCGDVESQRKLHQICPYKQKVTLPVLSYHVDDAVNNRAINDQIKLFERVLFPGLEPHTYSSVWIQHVQRDNNFERVDIHGSIINMDLLTGKQISPYVHAFDMKRVDIFKRIINCVYEYAEPSSAEHSRYIGSTSSGASHDVATIVRKVITESSIKTREELAERLLEYGYRVIRKADGTFRSRKSLSVITPSGKKVRLRGDPFEVVKDYVTQNDVTASRTGPVYSLDAMLNDLNFKCLERARRNWLRYRANTSDLTLEQTKESGFGYTVITKEELYRSRDEAKIYKRDRQHDGRSARRNEGGEYAATRSGATLGGEAPRTEPSSKRITTNTEPGRVVKTQRPIEDFVAKLGEIKKAIVERLRQKMKIKNPQQMGS